MTRLIPVRIPIKGLNTVNPFADINEGYARELTNKLIINGALKTRPAIRSYKYNASTLKLAWYDASADSGIEQSTGDIVTVSTAATTGTIGGAASYNTTTTNHLSLALVFGCGAPRIQAAPFTAWTFTTITISATAIYAGCSHKGRLYVTVGKEINYSSVGQVTGAMYAYLNFADILEGQDILRMFSVSVQPGQDTQNVLVLFGGGGKVLVYSGTYPDSAGWQLIGNYNMPTPTSICAFQEIDGDILVQTDKYAYWFRDLFSGGAQTAYDNSPTRPIEDIWQYQTWSTNNTTDPANSQAVYIGKVGTTSVDGILCQCYQENLGISQYGPNETITFFYHRKYKAWSLWLGVPFFNPVRLQGGVYYAASYAGEIVKLDDTLLVDEYTGTGNTIDIETSWKTPYISPFDGQNQKVEGVRPHFANSVSGYYHKIRAIFDYSDYNAPFGHWTQSSVTDIPPGKYTDGQIDNVATSWARYNPFKNLGGLGEGFSMQFTEKRKAASSATQSQQIYAASILVSDGGPIF